MQKFYKQDIIRHKKDLYMVKSTHGPSLLCYNIRRSVHYVIPKDHGPELVFRPWKNKIKNLFNKFLRNDSV